MLKPSYFGESRFSDLNITAITTTMQPHSDTSNVISNDNNNSSTNVSIHSSGDSNGHHTHNTNNNNNTSSHLNHNNNNNHLGNGNGKSEPQSSPRNNLVIDERDSNG